MPRTSADAVEILDAVIRGCSTAFAVDSSDITVLDEQGVLRYLACPNEPAGRILALEACAEEGSAAECVRTGEPVNVADLHAQCHRWPCFAPLALREGLTSVQALPLRDGRTTLGALTLFERAADALSDKDLRSAQVFADLAVVALGRTARSPRPLAARRTSSPFTSWTEPGDRWTAPARIGGDVGSPDPGRRHGWRENRACLTRDAARRGRQRPSWAWPRGPPACSPGMRVGADHSSVTSPGGFPWVSPPQVRAPSFPSRADP